MNYLHHQTTIYLHTLQHTFRLLSAAPLGWLAIWVFVTLFMFVTLLASLLPITGYLFLFNICLFTGIVSTADALNHEAEYTHQNRTLDPFFAPLRADERFFGFTLGLASIVAVIAWGGLLHQFYPPAQHNGLPNFWFATSGKILFFSIPILWIWFSPSYLIYHGESLAKAMMFSVAGCLKNSVSLFLLLISFALPIALIVSATPIQPIILLPLWTLFYIMIGVSSYAHFCMIYVRDDH